MASLIGALRVTLSADTAAFSSGMKRAERQAAASTNAIGKSLTMVKAGIAGLAAGLTVGFFGDLAKRALEYAGGLGEVAQQLNVTTKELQVFRYIATQAGVSQQELDKGLQKLSDSMGQLALGNKTVERAFVALLGPTAKVQLAGKTAGEAMAILSDRFAQIKDPAQQAAAAKQLFGRAGQQLLPILTAGKKGIEDFARAAEEMGLVLSDEQIQNADRTADKLAELKAVLEARIAGIVADNAESIYSLATSFAELAAGLAKFWGSNPREAMAILGALGGAMIGGRAGPWGFAAGAIGGGVAGYALTPESMDSLKAKREAARREANAYARAQGYRGKNDARDIALVRSRPDIQARLTKFRTLDAEIKRRSGGSVAVSSSGGGSIDLPEFMDTSGGGRKTRGKSTEQLAREAERQRREALRAEYQFTSDQRRGSMDMLRAKQGLTDDYVERSNLQLQIIDLEHQQEQAALAHSVAMGDITEAQAGILAAYEDQRVLLEKQAVNREVGLQRERDAEDVSRAQSEVQQRNLESQAQLARTAAERREIELRILDAAYEEERRRLARIRDDERLDEAVRQRARIELEGLNSRRGNDRQAVIRGTMGPMEAYLDSIPKTAAEMNEAFEGIRVRGIQSLIDGIAEAGGSVKKLGAVFKDVARQIVADLIRIQLQKALVSGLSSALGGLFGGVAGGGSAAGVTSSARGAAAAIAGATRPRHGFATGGAFTIQGRKGYDTNLLSLNGVGIARVSHGERVAISPEGGGGGITVNQHFAPNFAGNAATREDLVKMGQIAKLETLSAFRDLRSRGAL